MRRVQTTRGAVAWNIGWTPVSYDAEITTIWWWTPIPAYDGNYNTAREAEARLHNDRTTRLRNERDRIVDEILEQAELNEIRNHYATLEEFAAEVPDTRTNITSWDTVINHWETIQLVSRSTYERREQNWTLDNNVVYYVYEDDDFTGKWEAVAVPPRKEVAYFID